MTHSSKTGLYCHMAVMVLAIIGLLASCISSPAPAEVPTGSGGAASLAAPPAKDAASAGSSTSPGSRLDTYLDLKAKAFSARDTGQSGAALDLATAALALYPDASELQWVRFWSYQQLGYPVKAGAILEQLIKDQDYTLRNHYHEIGDFHAWQRKDARAAIEWYTKMIDLEPDQAGWSYHHRGSQWLQLGETARARADMEAAKAIADFHHDTDMQSSIDDYLKRITEQEARK